MKNLSLTDSIKTCAQIGYDGIELALMSGYVAEPNTLNSDSRKELRTQLKNYKLKLLAMMENLAEPATTTVQKSNNDRLKAAFDLWHTVAPDTPPLIETILGGKPAEWEKNKNVMVERMQDWAELARNAGAVIAIKPHVGNALHTVEGAIWFMKQIDRPQIRIGFDYSHLVLRGVPLETAINSLIPYSAFVHVKDARGKPEKFEFLLPGTEGIDYAEYAQRLSASKYAGPVVVEVSGMISNKPNYDAKTAAQKSFSNLSAAFGRRKQ